MSDGELQNCKSKQILEIEEGFRKRARRRELNNALGRRMVDQKRPPLEHGV